MKRLLLPIILLAAPCTLPSQTGVQHVLLPFGIWPMCENLLPPGLPIAPVLPETCANFVSGNETFVLSMNTVNERTVAFQYAISFQGLNGPETLTGIVPRDTGHSGWSNSTPLPIGRANEGTAQITITELVPLLVSRSHVVR